MAVAGKQGNQVKPSRLTSYILLKWIAEQENLRMREKAFLYALVTFWGPNGDPFPGTMAIAKAMGCSKATASEAKKGIRDKRLDGIRIIGRTGKGSSPKHHLTNIYAFNKKVILEWWHSRCVTNPVTQEISTEDNGETPGGYPEYG